MSHAETEFLDHRARLARARIGSSVARTGALAKGFAERTVRRHPLTSMFCAFAAGTISGGSVARAGRGREGERSDEPESGSGILAGALALLTTVTGRALVEKWIGGGEDAGTSQEPHAGDELP